MKVTENEKWREIFGPSWAKITDVCPEIGGFLIDHTTREVFMDANARKMAEIEEQPDYDAMIGYIDIISNDTTSFSRLAPQVFFDDGKYTAGILRWHYDFSGVQAKNVVPMVEKHKLSALIDQATTPSLLALIEFSMSDLSDLEEYHLFGALTSTISAMPNGAVFCAERKNIFWLYIPDFLDNDEVCLSDAQLNVRESGQGNHLGETGVGSRYITFTAGIGVGIGKHDVRMGTAEFALYEANMDSVGSIKRYSSERYESNRVQYEKMQRFYKLTNENLFIYHFQPIVSAKNGEVVAYEMLMRTDPSINMNPLEILECAEQAGRLYEIEKATMRNALSIIEKHQDIFRTRKLFVNSITAYALSDEDWSILVQRYGELMEKMVIEFTEGTELDDKGIDELRRRFVRLNIKTAIDDFGTGYSNTYNLIKYSPNYVKIDRSLISCIDSKPAIRKLVSGFIEFIHESGYYALAEGVETYEELQTMIQLGADYIQGFYVSRPKPIMLYQVSDNIFQDIEKINLINSGSIARPYYPEEGEEVDIVTVKNTGYNSVLIECQKVTLLGSWDAPVDIAISVRNDVTTEITLKNVKIKTEREHSTFTIGENCQVLLNVTGNSEIDGRGLHVPSNSQLKIVGDGCLSIISNSEDCYGIGAGVSSSPGNIIIDIDGQLNVRANGDTAIGIGGGHNENNTAIKIISGEVNVMCSGRSCVGIGIYESGCNAEFENCCCKIEITAPNVVGIGSSGEDMKISMKNFRLSETLSGIRAVGVGNIENGSGSIDITDGEVDMTIKARIANCIGTRGGNIDCSFTKSTAKFYCESGSVSGIGDMLGSGSVNIEGSTLDFDFRSADGFAYGTKTGKLSVADFIENVRINE